MSAVEPIIPDRDSPAPPENGKPDFTPRNEDTHVLIRGLSKRFGSATLYSDFDIDFRRGHITTIFGPNGCGKSTLINMVAGLLPMDAGAVRFDGKVLAETTIGYVFQNYRDALFPWMTARQNIEYPLRILRQSKADRAQRVKELVEALEISFDLDLHPYNLSGGQQQLVSIMRALAPKPEVLFLDEPFSALDYEMTLFIRDRLQRICSQTGITMIVVSHDLEEAVYLADEVLLLTKPPTRVAAIVPVEAARPRDDSTLSDPAFIKTKSDCLQIFQQEVRK